MQMSLMGKIQHWNRQVWNFASQRSIISKDAQLTWVTATFGARLSKLNQAIVLDGTGSNAQLLGLAFTDARQHLDVSTAQEHLVTAIPQAIYSIEMS